MQPVEVRTVGIPRERAKGDVPRRAQTGADINICPFCQYHNESGVATCAKCTKQMYTEPQTEWGSYISQVGQGYKQPPAKGIAHGVQKDAVQNSWGARLSGRGKGRWGTEFALVKGGDGTNYLTILDWGTYGLTGQAFDDPEAIPDQLPPDERLARFENMNFSGGNYGPGLYGRGKLIFQAASKRREIIYDALTSDGVYRLGRRFQDGRHLRQFPRVLEGDDAKRMLAALTNGALKPLAQTGTRITIVEPLDEIAEAITSGDMLRFIEETWWEILLKHDAEILVTTDGSPGRTKCPDWLSKLANGALPDKQVHRVENQTVEVKGKCYRIKRLYMAKADKLIPEELRGLYVQRGGMKVGTIELKEMPPDLEEHFFGFIELDKDYEELIAEAEGLEHYGFSALYASYRELKKFAQAEFDNFKRKLGYAVDTQKDADQRAREALRAAHQKLNEIMDNLGLSGLGELPPRKREITVCVENVTFPNGTSEVNIGDVISDIVFRTKNNSPYDRTLKVFVETHRASGAVIETLYSDTVQLASRAEKSVGPLTLVLHASTYPNFEQITCICRVEDTTGRHLAHARIPIFIGLKRQELAEAVKLWLEAAEFPRSKSLRVNFGEEIKNIHYTILNQVPHELKVKFLVRTLDKQHDKQRIATVVDQNLVLKPNAERDVMIPSILVDATTYQAVGEGEMILRARVVSDEDQHGHEKGDVLAEHNLIFWLNRDPKGQGIFEDTEFFDGGSNALRSEVRQGSTQNRWVFRVNITHPHYEAIREGHDQALRDGEMDRYFFELMAREALYLALHVEKFEVFNNEVKLGDQPHEVSRAYNAQFDRVLAAYYQ